MFFLPVFLFRTFCPLWGRNKKSFLRLVHFISFIMRRISVLYVRCISTSHLTVLAFPSTLSPQMVVPPLTSRAPFLCEFSWSTWKKHDTFSPKELRHYKYCSIGRQQFHATSCGCFHGTGRVWGSGFAVMWNLCGSVGEPELQKVVLGSPCLD